MTYSWKNVKCIESKDENVKKFIFSSDEAVAEAVLYKYPTYEDRTVICCSTQSGCPVGCRFCGAGDHFVRSLTEDEIVEQVVQLVLHTGVYFGDIKNLQVMFMSMGEPMHNFTELEKAIRILNDYYPNAKLLISTSAPRVWGEFEKLNKLSREISNIGLQFSVHESTNEARFKLIPSPTSTLEEISELGEDWFQSTGRTPFLNYCVHDGNNKDEDVDRLFEIFDPHVWQVTLSVICERDENVAAANERQEKLAKDFSHKMHLVGYGVRVFNPAGQDDIGGGCGMLWFVQKWMKEHPDKVKNSKGFNLPKVHAPK